MKGICKICGEIFDTAQFETCGIRTIMENEHVCFKCGFWIEKQNLYNENTLITEEMIRFQGSIVDKTENKSPFLGMGGRDLFFEMLSGPDKGKVRWYNSVWCQGNIPEYFKNSPGLKINTKQVTEEEFTENQIEIVSELKPGQILSIFEKSGKQHICYFTETDEKKFYEITEDKLCYSNLLDTEKIFYIEKEVGFIEPVDYDLIPNLKLINGSIIVNL